jgi:hypothetical protein
VCGSKSPYIDNNLVSTDKVHKNTEVNQVKITNTKADAQSRLDKFELWRRKLDRAKTELGLVDPDKTSEHVEQPDRNPALGDQTKTIRDPQTAYQGIHYDRKECRYFILQFDISSACTYVTSHF